MKPEFGDLSILTAPPVPMAYVGLHPVCGHALAVVPDRGARAAQEAADLAAGLELARVTMGGRRLPPLRALVG